MRGSSGIGSFFKTNHHNLFLVQPSQKLSIFRHCSKIIISIILYSVAMDHIPVNIEKLCHELEVCLQNGEDPSKLIDLLKYGLFCLNVALKKAAINESIADGLYRVAKECLPEYRPLVVEQQFDGFPNLEKIDRLLADSMEGRGSVVHDNIHMLIHEERLKCEMNIHKKYIVHMHEELLLKVEYLEAKKEKEAIEANIVMVDE